MKGQVKIEFLLGIVVFAVIIFYVGSQIGTAFTSLNTDTKLDILKAKSVTVLDILTKDSVNGLALEDPVNKLSIINNLDETRIAEWDANRGPNGECLDMEKFDLDGYRLVINKADTEVLFCGFVGITRIRSNAVRFVKIGAEYGDITLELW